MQKRNGGYNLDSNDRLSENEQPREKSIPESLSIEIIFQRYKIERSHADNVTRNALELFDVLGPIHGLRPEMRKFVEIAALVHDTGVSTDLENHHKAGRDILCLHPPSELPERLWPAVAWTTFLHKKKIEKKKLIKLKEKAFGKMPEDLQDLTLKTAALIRLADALDYSRKESRLGDMKVGEKKVILEIVGPAAVIDAERMNIKGDLWHLLFDTRLEFKPVMKDNHFNNISKTQ
jgi:exopolyphosphatase/pppGpp-phosphohydrolase